jgi:hypothetical protein
MFKEFVSVAFFLSLITYENGCTSTSGLSRQQDYPDNRPIEVHTLAGNVYRFHIWSKTRDGSIIGVLDKPDGRYADTSAWRPSTQVVPVDSILGITIFDDTRATTAQVVFSTIGIAVCTAAIIYFITVITKWPGLGSE